MCQQPAPGVGAVGQLTQQGAGGGGCGQELVKRLAQRQSVAHVGPPGQRAGAGKVGQQLGRALVRRRGLRGLGQAALQGNGQALGGGIAQGLGRRPGQRAQVDLQLVNAQQFARGGQGVAGGFDFGQQARQVELAQRLAQGLGVVAAAAGDLQHLALDAVLLDAGHG